MRQYFGGIFSALGKNDLHGRLMEATLAEIVISHRSLCGECMHRGSHENTNVVAIAMKNSTPALPVRYQ